VAEVEAAEFRVRVADTVPAALEAFERENAAAVIAQAQMGTRSGVWLLEWTKVLQPTTFTVLLSLDSQLESGNVDLTLRLPLPPSAIVGRLGALAPECKRWEPAAKRPTIELEPVRIAESDG
jgi:DNA-binding response OmpR family regulator